VREAKIARSGRRGAQFAKHDYEITIEELKRLKR
jgi:hypothetical protein